MRTQRNGNAVLGLCSIIVLPLLFLIDSGVAFMMGWRSDSRLDTLLVFLASFALIVPSLGMLIRPMRQCVADRAIQITFFMGTLALSLLCGEAVVRIALPDMIEYHTRGPNLSLILKPNPKVVPGMDRETHYTTNSRGLRGPSARPGRSPSSPT